MKIKQLESLLQQIEQFNNPKVELEQYPTSAHIASHILMTAESAGDIKDKIIADLGVGCGIFTIGSQILNSAYNIGVDIDIDALNQCKSNCEEFDAEVDLICANIETGLDLVVDTVLMNPPFGTKKAGIDMVFLQVASKVILLIFILRLQKLLYIVFIKRVQEK